MHRTNAFTHSPVFTIPEIRHKNYHAEFKLCLAIARKSKNKHLPPSFLSTVVINCYCPFIQTKSTRKVIMYSKIYDLFNVIVVNAVRLCLIICFSPNCCPPEYERSMDDKLNTCSTTKPLRYESAASSKLSQATGRLHCQRSGWKAWLLVTKYVLQSQSEFNQ